MSFDATSFFLLTDSIGGKAKRVFAYLTNDTQDQIAAAGYFTGVGKKFGVQVGDLVLVASLANAYPTSALYFSAVSATTGNATAADTQSGRRPYAEKLIPSGTNAFPALHYQPAGSMMLLLINGQGFTTQGGDFSVSGQTITWLNGQISVLTTDNVVALYSY